jgi:hypothetical protein
MCDLEQFCICCFSVSYLAVSFYDASFYAQVNELSRAVVSDKATKPTDFPGSSV